MKHFEIMFILKPDLTEKEIHDKLFDVKTYIRKLGGNVIKEDVWGTKNLAYKNEGYYRGIYCLFAFDAPYGIIKELGEMMKQDKAVLRSMIITKPE